MFEGVYGKAFKTFLEMTELPSPDSLDHPTVGLFLLVCDMAINPSAGFPFALWSHASFITDTDPGIRFLFLARSVRKDCPEVIGAIRSYSREEYAFVTSKLAKVLLDRSPLEIAEEFGRWADSAPFTSLMEEHRTFKFGRVNLPVRVLFAHFLSFMRDKLKNPEFFCWPGPWMAGDRLATSAFDLFDRHGALFVDQADDDGIFPRLPVGRSVYEVDETFQAFYAANVTYDLTRQWITESGSFKYDYQWLSQSGSAVDIQGFADRTFESVYGFRPPNVTLVS
jgi:hypothetical protein